MPVCQAPITPIIDAIHGKKIIGNFPIYYGNGSDTIIGAIPILL